MLFLREKLLPAKASADLSGTQPLADVGSRL